MAHINYINVHDCEKIRVQHVKAENGVEWLAIGLGGFDVNVFDVSTEDLRAALYRADMEVYDADRAI